MFNFLKNLFSSRDYEKRFMATVEKFSNSDNIYDVKLALIMMKCHNKNIDWDEVDEWLSAKNVTKEKMLDSLNRFSTELYS
jgi:hypothetical protein